MTAQASNTGPLICRLILMPNDPLGQINSNNPHPCLSSLLAQRTEASRSRARAPQHRRSRPWGSRGSSATWAKVTQPRRFANLGRSLLPVPLCHVSTSSGSWPSQARATGPGWAWGPLPPQLGCSAHSQRASGQAHGWALVPGQHRDTKGQVKTQHVSAPRFRSWDS